MMPSEEEIALTINDKLCELHDRGINESREVAANLTVSILALFQNSSPTREVVSQGHDKASYRNGLRAAITWLHERANSMNDQKAKAILNSAAFTLGTESNALAQMPSVSPTREDSDCEDQGMRETRTCTKCCIGFDGDKAIYPRLELDGTRGDGRLNNRFWCCPVCHVSYGEEPFTGAKDEAARVRALIPQPSLDAKSSEKVEEAVAFELGKGKVVIDTGTWHGKPAVFIAAAKHPGTPGESASREGNDRYSLQPGEQVIIASSHDHAKLIADAFCNKALSPSSTVQDGAAQSAPTKGS